jgi:nitrogen fixation NifU-like protein
MSLEELYREVILDHYRNPRNRAAIEDPDASAEGVNPLCGDEVTVELSLDGDRVTGVSVRGQGCSISQSSASMMSEAIKGKTRAEIVELEHRFKSMLSTEDGEIEFDAEHPGAVLGELEALQGVRNYPVRIKCASLPWATLEDALSG